MNEQEIKEKLKEMLDNPRTGLKESSDTNKTRMGIFALFDEVLQIISQEKK